jgi:hypothetical protein
MDKSILTGLMVVWLTAFLPAGRAYTPPLSELPLQASVTRDNITWTFTQPTRVGQFVNGDYYVVGPCTVSAIDPAPTASPGRHGSVLNLPVNQGQSGFDDRVSSGRYTASLRVYPPVRLKAGDALVSSISIGSLGAKTAWLREGQESTETPDSVYAVLTCLAAPAATDAFRPAYCDRAQKLYYADSLRTYLLPSLAKPASIVSMAAWTEHFSHTWLDVCFFGFDAALKYQPLYGREVGRSTGMATLLLVCDFTPAEKRGLLVGLVQYGIDLWGIARAGYSGWQAHGGHGTGRKWPIIFSGLMLGDAAMASPSTTYPNLRFGEDLQTMYATGWTGANVVYAGHTGVWNGQPVSSSPGWGPYEHLQPSQWYCCESGYSSPLGETYRRCCTSISWIATALSARLLNAQSLWGHDAFFDYCDRWMTEDDSQAIQIIQQQGGWNFSASYARQGQAWDAFTNQMWASYRNTGIEQPGPYRPGARFGQLYISNHPFRLGFRPLGIGVTLSRSTHLTVAVYDAAGKMVKGLLDRPEKPGNVSVAWDGRDGQNRFVKAGVYQVRAAFDGTEIMEKIVVMGGN